MSTQSPPQFPTSLPDHAPAPEHASPISPIQPSSAGSTDPPIATWPEFVSLVARMRAAQSEYFRTRSRSALIQSKQLEHQVDAIIAHGLDNASPTDDPAAQLDLFPGGAG